MRLMGRGYLSVVQQHRFVLVTVIVLAAFWRCLSLPFIQDDWVWIETFQRVDAGSLIAFLFDTHNFFYRPLAQIYFLSIYKIFGDHAFPFHVSALLIHISNSVLVVSIFSEIAKSRLIGLMTGLIYAAAVSIHVDSLSWMVGMYDLGAAFFFFVTIQLVIKQRYWLSIGAFLIAALFKESVVVLPIILIGIEIFFGANRTSVTSSRIFLRHFPYLVISAFIFFLKVKSSLFSMALPAEHPYALELLNGQVFTNFYLYMVWMAQAVVPIKSDLPIFAVLVLFLITGMLAFKKRGWNNFRCSLILLLVGWIWFCLMPTLFLPNHVYRYYAIYSLPAFISLVLLMTETLMKVAGLSELKIKKILLFMGVLIVSSSVIQSNRVFGQGLEQRSFSKGTNLLIRRAAFVDLTRAFLLNNFSTFPDDAVLVFDGVDIWAFNKDSGPRVWYNNKTLRVYEFRDLRYNSGRWLIHNPAENQVEAHAARDRKDQDIDAANLYVFRLLGNRLHRVSIDELKQIVPSRSAVSDGSIDGRKNG